jgi:ribosome-associated translation inhibitor RaiA
MHINIQSRGFDLTEGLRGHTLLRMQFALGWAHQHLRRVTVHLSDENGPRGGEDKRCRIRIGVDGPQYVVIEDIQADLYVAIARAADRAGRVLARRLERQRLRRGGLPPVAEDAPVGLPR